MRAVIPPEARTRVLPWRRRYAGFGDQNTTFGNAFDSAAIEGEVTAMYPQQPAVNVPEGWSPTWQALYDNYVNGQFIAPPYHDVKVTDPVKLASMTAAYQDYVTGKATTLPNIQDVMLDSGLRDMGFAPKAGLDGKALLVQMCQQCHNANLDPILSRDNFLVDQLDQMSYAEKIIAVERIRDIPQDDRLTMPPTLFRTVTAEERAAMVSALQQ